jgi:uncharacterized membrane protein
MGSRDNASAVYHILAFCFADPKTARQVDKDLKRNQWAEGYAVLAHAVVEVDDKGKVHVHEPGHGVLTGTLGAATGGVLALIGGPAGVLAWAVAGGAIGGAVGHYFGRAIPVDDLKKLGEQMEPNSSAIVALVEDLASENVIDSMEGYNANVVTLTVGDELSGQIAQYAAGQAIDDQGNVVAAESAVVADAEGNVVGVGAVAAGSADDNNDDDSSS